MRRSMTVLALLGALIAGVGMFWVVSRKSFQEHETAQTALTDTRSELEEERGERQRIERELAETKRQVRRAEAAAKEAREEVVELTARLEKAETKLAELAPPEAESGPKDWRDLVAEYPAYTSEEVEEWLDGVDWVQVGTSMSNMPPLIEKLAKAIAEGEDLQNLPPETIGNIQKYNAPLVTTALTMSQKGLPGTGANGAFSHPAFMVNAMAAALEALEMPLSERQSGLVERLGVEYTRRDEQRRAAYGDETSDLVKLRDESLLRRAFFREAYDVLTEEQHLALRPEATRGRLQLDIFSESLIWTGRAGPLPATDRDNLAAKVSEWVARRGGLPPETYDRVREIVKDWVDALPASFVEVEPDTLTEGGMMHVDQVNAAAQHVSELQDTLLTSLTLDEDAAKRLRAIPGTVVPYRKAGD